MLCHVILSTLYFMSEGLINRNDLYFLREDEEMIRLFYKDLYKFCNIIYLINNKYRLWDTILTPGIKISYLINCINGDHLQNRKIITKETIIRFAAIWAEKNKKKFKLKLI